MLMVNVRIAASNLNTDHSVTLMASVQLIQAVSVLTILVDIDGERPVTLKIFEVAKTLDIDGQRPIVSANSSEKPEFIKDFTD